MSDFLDATTLVWVIAFFPLWMLTTYVHELGHAGFGVLVGFRPRAVGSGISGRALAVRVRGVVFYQSTGNLSQGLTLCGMPALVPDRWRTVVYMAGGILANLLVGVGLAGGWLLLDGEPWLVSALVGELAVFNLLSGLLNLLPFQVQVGSATVATDGRGIINAIRRQPGPPLANTVNTYRVLRPLLTTIGDHATRSALAAESARFWAMLGRPAYGRTFLADGEPPTGHPLERGMAAYTRFWLAAAEGDPAVAEAELIEADVLFVRVGDRAGQCLVALSRVDLLTVTGRHDDAVRQLDALAGPEWKSVGLKLDEVRTLLAAKAAAMTVAASTADRMLSTVEAATVDPAVRAAVMREVGEVFAKAGLWDRAERAERLNAAAVAAAGAVLADPADKAEIDAVYAAVQERIRTAVVAQGKEPDAAAALDPTAGEQAVAARQDRLWWWAVTIAAVTFVVGLYGLLALICLPFAQSGHLPPVTKWVALAATLLVIPPWWVIVQGVEWGWYKLRRKPRPNAGVSALVTLIVVLVLMPAIAVYVVSKDERERGWYRQRAWEREEEMQRLRED